MLLKFALFACLLTLGLAAILKAPIHKNKESHIRRLLREKKHEELRAFNRIQMAKYARGGQIKLDKTKQPLYDYGNQEYNVRLSIGTPGQTFELLPDTSSGNTWITDKTCDGSNPYYDCPSFCRLNEDWCVLYCYSRCCNNPTQSTPLISQNDEQDPCAGKKKFDSSASSTYSTDGTTFQIPFGLGNVSGVLGTDSFTLGDPSKSTVTIPGAMFGQVNRLSTSYAGSAFDGVLGLAFQDVAVGGVKPIFQTGVDQGIFDQPIFTIYMQPDNQDDVDIPVGSITFGGLDTDNCASSYTTIKLISDAVWWFNIDGVSTSGQKQQTGPFLTMSSIGTSLNLVPPSVLYDLVLATNAQYDFNIGFYSLKCDSTFTWSIFVNGVELSADQSTLMFKTHDECYLKFGSWEDELHKIDIILGVPFLQQFCVAHDVTQGQIGFAKAK